METSSAASAPASCGIRPAACPDVHVLAADSKTHDLCYVRDILTKAGYASDDSEDGARFIDEEMPHMVLLDSDGVEPMNDIRKTADESLIFLSMYGQDETVARAIDMGARRLLGQVLLADRA